MQPLELYSKIEQYLDFEEEVTTLYEAIGKIVISKEPKTLIDIGCGQGEFCNILNHNNIKTFGIDLSKKQIKIAKEKNLDVEAVDIKEIKKTFDCATATFDVLNYIKKPNLDSFIKNCAKVLKKDGYFIFDINSLFGFENVAQGTLNIELEDKFIAIDATFEADTLYTKITLFTKKEELYKKQNGTIEQYYHKNKELEKVLNENSFEIEKIISFNLHSEDDPDKFIFVCRKV